MKKIILSSIVFAALLCGILFNSCESATYGDLAMVENPTYNENISPLFRSTCAGCHSSNGQFPALDNYENIKDGIENGDVICRIDDQSCGAVMPQSGRMPQSVIDMIKLWRDQGFVNQ